MEWISLKDELPKNQGEYLIYYPTIINHTFSCWFNGIKFCHSYQDGFTHWMTLPKPPKND